MMLMTKSERAGWILGLELKHRAQVLEHRLAQARHRRREAALNHGIQVIAAVYQAQIQAILMAAVRGC